MSLFLKIWKYIWPHIRQHRTAFFSIVILFSARVFIDHIIIPLYFKEIIDTISVPNIDHTSLSSELFGLVYVIIGLTFLVSLTARSRQFIYNSFLINIVKKLRDFSFQKIEQNSPTFFSNTFAGSLVTKSRRFVGAFEHILDISIFGFLNIFVILIGVFAVLVKQSGLISIIFFSLMTFYVIAISFFIKKKMKYDLLEAEQDSRISGRLADTFGNILAVKFFSARKNEIKSFGEYTQEGADRSRRALNVSAQIETVQSFLNFVILSTMLYTLIFLWVKGEISTGTVVLIESYTGIVLFRLWDLSNNLTRFMKSISDMKEMIDIFEVVPDVLDPKSPEKPRINNGLIKFEDVSFQYAVGDEVLSNFNLVINPGERVGIVGHSGAGKSTITRLILRFNDITKGNITIDGQDIKNIKQADLRKFISYVPQEPILFHRPIRENIAYGKDDVSEKEIVDVAQKAHAHEFISKLPKGYDTLVGERGVKLSGGERQRVAIARAMLKPAPILVLDEATSSLDSVSESYIQDAFDSLMKNKTTIVIAHRLSTIQKMDRIIVLDNGHVVEEGKHQDLLTNKGIYADLWEHQTGGFLE